MTGSEPDRQRVGVRDIEDLRGTHLAADDRDELFTAQTECTVAYLSREGWPAAVVMSFLRRDGRFWLTAVGGRDHLESLRGDPRLTIVVDNRGTGLPGRRMVAVQGTVVVREDRATKDWFYPAFAERMAADDPAAFVRLLDSPRRAVLEVTPTGKQVSHDSRKIAGDGRGGPRS
ncbi:pyridoxamine 5'-phosphate oxidase family protein [Geodermatophilus sp. CPCC 205761]|uniref:pyridoxamine 5'-phosphate oxidase family protein n=1 Tax=Geodermatophilus sp. CPCC 205761 TaxID=2936597 RepID=UPI003EE8F5FA